MKDLPRLILAAGVLLLFAYAYIQNPNDELMTGAVISLATMAASYWLGSSKGSSDKSEELARQASAEPRQVEVVNPPERPAHVEEVCDA